MLLSQTHNQNASSVALKSHSVVPLTKYLMTTAYFQKEVDLVASRWLEAFGLGHTSNFYDKALCLLRKKITDYLALDHASHASTSYNEAHVDVHTAINTASVDILEAWLTTIFHDKTAFISREMGFSSLRFAFICAYNTLDWHPFFLEDTLPEAHIHHIKRHLVMYQPRVVLTSIQRQEI